MGSIGCPITSVRNYHYAMLKNPEERSSRLPHGGSVKSRIVFQGMVFVVTIGHYKVRTIFCFSSEQNLGAHLYLYMYELFNDSFCLLLFVRYINLYITCSFWIRFSPFNAVNSLGTNTLLMCTTLSPTVLFASNWLFSMYNIPDGDPWSMSS